jgi:hypothetical protein
VDSIDLVQDRDQLKAIVNTVNRPLGSLKCSEILE